MKNIYIVEGWLDESVRNEHYFKSDNILLDKGFLEDWAQVISTLGKSELNANTREDYLRWVGVWKSLYSRLTDEIRYSKSGRKTVEHGDGKILSRSKPYTFAVAQVNAKNAMNLREAASFMMSVRSESKIKAGKRRAAATIVDRIIEHAA